VNDGRQRLDPLAETPTGIERLVAEHQGHLRAYILSLVLHPTVAEDVLQETNIVLWKKANEFEPGTNFKAWAFRVAWLEVRRQRRTAGRDRLVFDDELVGQIEAEAGSATREYEARRKMLLRCLRKLGGEQRRLVIERYFAGRAVKEIAAERNRSVNLISQLLFRARQSLANCVASLEDAQGARGGPRPRAG
jgi:RNA polymerase sigma-70 factor, ECF subfamily